MKIVVVGTRGFPGIQGGIESHCEQLYSHLVTRGCDVTVFARKPYITYEKEEYKGIKIIPLGCPKYKFLETIIHTFKGVVKSKKLRPDVLHIHAIGPSLFAPLARLLGMKVVVTSHGPDYKRKKWPVPAKVFLKFCERMGVTYSNAVITIAKNISDDIREQYGRESTIIPNGVNIPTATDSYETLKQYVLERKKYILAVGRFVPEKGFNDLIEAFDNLLREQSESESSSWKLVIVGDADHEDKYSRGLKTAVIGNRHIVLTGFLTGQPLHELFCYAGLFVLPSYFEGLPIVLLEAMSYGLSCIASDIPANRSVALDDDRYFTAGDVHQISEKIKAYIIRPWNSEQKKSQIEMVKKEYNWGKIADMTLKVYKNVILQHSN